MQSLNKVTGSQKPKPEVGHLGEEFEQADETDKPANENVACCAFNMATVWFNFAAPPHSAHRGKADFTRYCLTLERIS